MIMAIAFDGKMMAMVCYWFLFIALSQSSSIPRCYKIPPTNAKSPPILNKYRGKYDFVLKRSGSQNIQTSRTRTQGSQKHKTKCPWAWAISDNVDRYPRVILYATCRGCESRCKPVTFSHKVLYTKCDYNTGETVWRWANEELNVAFVYTIN